MKRSIALKIAIFLTIIFSVNLSSSPRPMGGDEAREAMLPESLIDLGSGGSFAILVDKSYSRIDVYQQLPGNRITKVKSYRTSTGQVQGDKHEEGDLRTPEGIYYLTRIREDRDLMSKYGSRAFDLNYPNEFDRKDAKTGHGIWLHGTDQPMRLTEPRTSEGCVVVSNEDIAEISRYITLFRTPIIIAEKPTFVSVAEREALRAKVNNFVLRWLDAWANQDYTRYFECYSPSFKRSSGEMRAWQEQKKSVFRNTRWAAIDIADLKILKDGSRFLVGFYQRYQSNLMDDTGIKWVYVSQQEEDLKILSEEWYPVGKALTGERHYTGIPPVKSVIEAINEVALEPSGRLAIARPQISLPFNVAEASGGTGRTIAADDGQTLSVSAEKTAEIVGEKRNTPETPVRKSRPQPPAFERVKGTADVYLDDLRIRSLGSRALNVHFKLLNRNQDGSRRRGRMFLVALWAGDNTSTAWPNAKLIGGVPASAAAGDYYGIKWGKEVDASLARPSASAKLVSIRCYIFDQQGRLISDEQVPLNQQEVNR